MSQFGELNQLIALFLQETEETERSKNNNGMDGGRLRRRKSLHQRLGLKSIVCCGSTWAFGIGSSDMSSQDVVIYNDVVDSTHQEIINNNDQNDVVEPTHQQVHLTEIIEDVQNDDVVESTHQQMVNNNNNNNNNMVEDENDVVECPRMNLADALAAERNFRSVGGTDGDDVENETEETTTPLRMSLMRLLEEAEMEGQDEEKESVGIMGRDQVCCVCMGRKKGAAFIPCGHTFCRVCCRELWLNRGSCPLCNRSILEILDIY